MVRCPGCRTRRATWQSMLKHVAATGHKACECGHVAYTGHAFPHRPGTPGCIHEKLDSLTGEPRAKMYTGQGCPF